MMSKIPLEIIALSHSVTQSSNYAVVLGEKNGSRKLPIVIGSFEAQAIAVALERMSPNRPLTHDLFKNVLETFQINVKEVIINDLIDGIFHARLVCEQDGEFFEVDSRTSDALALAVRFRCPVNTYEFILQSAGVELEGSQSDDSDSNQSSISAKKDGLEHKNMDELEEALASALEQEAYEDAAKIRDEIARRGAN